MYGVDGRKFQRQYRQSLSEYQTWEQRFHCEDWILYPDNLSSTLSLVIKGTQSDTVIHHLLKIGKKPRKKVKEITLDMAGSMKLIAKKCFPQAVQVIDRFHVQKLAIEALQEIRINHRWEAIDKESDDMEKARKDKVTHVPDLFANGDSRKQLLARSQYLFYKSPEKWTASQKERAGILFSEYPDLMQAYQITEKLRKIYNQNISKDIAMTKFAHCSAKLSKPASNPSIPY